MAVRNPLIFEVNDPQGRTVKFRQRTWDIHIKERHEEADQSWMRETIEDPSFICENVAHGSLNYYKVFSEDRAHMVSAKPRPKNADPPRWWELVTAYDKAIPPAGRMNVVWTKSG